MFISEVKIRVRYAETDQMGYVYYGNYATYFEVARVEALREAGANYSDLEKSGTLMPVLELKTKYIRPAKYDQVLTIKTCIKEMPKLRITFHYEVYNESGELLTMAETTLVFVSQDTMKPILVPPPISNVLSKHFMN